MPVEFTVEQKALQALARAVDKEKDGKKLRRDLSKTLREAMEPIKREAQSNVQSLRSQSQVHSNKTRNDRGRMVKLSDSQQSLRQAVADHVKAEGRLSGKATGARLRVPRKDMPRGFVNAARRLNRKSGWRHPIFKTGAWAQQWGRPAGWFDRATQDPRVLSDSRERVLAAMEEMARRVIRGAD